MPDLQNKKKVTCLARELFLRHGFLKITMDNIASVAGVSKKTIYQHFQNKDRLINYCIGEEIDQMCHHISIILSFDIGYAEKWNHCIRLITRRSFEAESVLYRDILSKPKQMQYFNKKKRQATDLILDSFVYIKGRLQLEAVLNSFMELLLLSATNQPGGISRIVFMQTMVSFYGQAYNYVEKSSVDNENPQLLKLVKLNEQKI